MKKKFLTMLLMFCLILPYSLFLSACGKGGGNGGSGKPGGHTHTWGEWTTVTDATCTEKGSKKRTCSGCGDDQTQDIDALGHHWEGALCTECGLYDASKDTTLSDGRELENIVVSKTGLLSWTGLKVASKYVLTFKDSSGTSHTNTATAPTKIFDLTNLDSGEMSFGKTEVTLQAYEKLEVSYSGQKYYQDTPIGTAKETFTIVNVNSGFSIVRKTYSDEYVTMKGIDSTVYHDETHGDYLLYEQAGKKGFKYSGEYKTFELLSNITPTDPTCSIRIYLSEQDKNDDDVFEEDEKIKMLGGEYQWIIVDVNRENGWLVKSYNVLLYCTRPLEIYLYKSERSEPDANGKVTETKTNVDIDMTVTENNILDINSIYDCIPEGMLIRDENYNIFEKNTDYNTKDMNIVGDIDYVLTPGKIYLYFAEETEVRELVEEVEDASELFDISFSNGEWNITYNESANNETLIVPALIIGYETNCLFKTDSRVRSIIFESGTTSLAAYLMKNCEYLESVKIPETVTSVGGWLFSDNLSSSFRIYLEGSVGDGFATWWNRIGNTTNLYTYYENQADCCSTVTKNNVSVKIDFSNEIGIVVGTTGTSVTIPETVNFNRKTYTVTTIQGLSSNLTTLSIPKTISTIEFSAFHSNIASVEISEENAKFKIVDNAFYDKNDSSLLHVLKSTTELKLLPNITEILGDVFKGLSKLETINIHAGITNIDLALFKDCQIKAFVVDEENQTYSSVEGNLYSKNGSEFIRVAIGKETTAVVPSSVTEIRKGAFNGYSLSKIEIPFVGGSANDNQYIGYLFDLSSYSKHSSMPSTLKEVVVNGEKIAKNAFNGCTSLTFVTISNSITEIGQYAFKGCIGLTSVSIPKSVTKIGQCAFDGCTSLKTVTFETDSALATIGSYAFKGCTGLTSVSIPKSVTEIGQYAFDGCTSLKTVTFETNSVLAVIDSYAFGGCTGLTSVTIPKSVTEIGQYAFNGCTKLATVTFETDSALATIDNFAFSGCTSLTSVTIPKSVTTIGSAFYSCEKLKTVTFEKESSLTTIGGSAFQCTALTTIEIPSSVETIGGSAFQACYSLKTVTLEDGSALGSVGEKVFYLSSNLTYNTYENNNYLGTKTNPYLVLCGSTSSNGYSETTIHEDCRVIAGSAFANCKNMKSINIPSSVIYIGTSAFKSSSLNTVTFEEGSKLTTIGESVFEQTRSLKTITIPSSVTTIGESAFENSNLETITIPSSVTTIGVRAFYYATSLNNIIFEEDSALTTIGSYAFKNCTGLTSVTIPESVTEIGQNAFESCQNLTTIVISKSVKSLGYNLFKTCKKLEKVFYCGTAQEYYKISGCEYVNCSLYFYSETKPTETGYYWHYVEGVATVWED